MMKKTFIISLLFSCFVALLPAKEWTLQDDIKYLSKFSYSRPFINNYELQELRIEFYTLFAQQVPSLKDFAEKAIENCRELQIDFIVLGYCFRSLEQYPNKIPSRASEQVRQRGSFNDIEQEYRERLEIARANSSYISQEITKFCQAENALPL